jgi:hypothetical protein
MSQNILMISVKILKERTSIHDNIDEKLIYPEIKAAQDIYVLPLLGTALFNKILTDISNSALAGDYKTLVDDYLIDMLCNYVLSELPDGINYQFTNKGVQSKTDPNASQPSMADMYSVVAKYKNRAEHYQKRAMMYLVQNGPTKFSEYLNPGQGVDDVRPDRNAFSNPIYLGEEFPRHRSYEERYQGNRPNCDNY